jgi:hypothetical protein
MPRRPAIPAALRRQIMAMDGGCCAYCGAPTVVGIPLVIEHITPLVAGSTSTVENLSLSCYRCNGFKGPRTEARDPMTGLAAPLFHPRHQRWAEHLAWDDEGSRVLGVTECGRATVGMLRLNNEWLVQARRIWVVIGIHPPRDRVASRAVVGARRGRAPALSSPPPTR